MNHKFRALIAMFVLPATFIFTLGLILVASSVPTQATSGSVHDLGLFRSDINDQLDTPTATDVPWNPPNFNPYDGRTVARAGDRLAVYCYAAYREIEVWGVDDNSAGIYLNTFDYDDVLAAGTQGMTVGLGANGSLSLTVDNQYNFVLYWNGPFNASHHGDFSKSFNCAYPGGSPTPRSTISGTVQPRLHSRYYPVYTVTPAPTVTPDPTESLY